MAVQKTLTLLIVMLSIAVILGRPVEENSNDLTLKDRPTPVEKLPPKYQLLVDTYKNFKNIASYYVNEALSICKNMLKDETLLARSSSAEIQAFQKNLTHFLEKYNNYSEPEAVFGFVDIFSDTTEFYLELPHEAISPDAAVIVATLKKYRFDKLEQKFQQLFNDAVVEFKQQFEATKPFLQTEKAMLEWFDHFKTLTDADEITAALETFVTFY